jgi:hypothetical protein
MKRRNATGKQSKTPIWVDAEERVARNAAMRGKPQPVSWRYQKFIEDRQGQLRLFADDPAKARKEA